MDKAAIIGAGIGGMSAAVRLAQKGFEVDVYEQNSFPGGKAHSVSAGGFRFDSGPSLITMPFVVKDLFDFAEEDIDEYLKFKELDVLCRYFYPDGTVLNAYKDTERFGEEIEAKTRDNRQDLVRFLNYAKNIYDLTSEIFLFGNLYSPEIYLRKSSVAALFGIKKIDVFRTMDKAVRSFFKDEKTIQLFCRYATYNGSSPFLAPATLNIIAYVENVLGGYYLEGGMQSLTDALFKVSENKGVNFHFGRKINRIRVSGSRVTGLGSGDGITDHNIVVSSADSIITNEVLLGNKKSPAADGNISSSAVVFYWSVKGVYADMGIHNILFAENYEKEFDHLFSKKKCSDDLTVYIYISSKFNPKDAPAGCENWFVMVNAPVNSGQDWDNEIKIIRENITRKINRTFGINVAELIVHEAVLTPSGIESGTGSYKGSIYGFSSNSKSSAFLRQPNRSKKYGGLYYCGGSTHPGGGIPLVMLSGKLTSELIFNDYLKKRTY